MIQIRGRRLPIRPVAHFTDIAPHVGNDQLVVYVIDDDKSCATTLPGVSEMTVKVHRRQITRKMRENSVVDLVRMADQLGLPTGLA